MRTKHHLLTKTHLLHFSILLLFVTGLFVLVAALPVQAADDQWHARYWNNRSLAGEPVLQQFEDTIDYDWGSGYPAPGINADEFSVKWTRDVEFPAGTYRFTATMDDGMRVWIDDELIIDSWNDSQVHTISADRYLTPGEHTIRVEYYEAGGDAEARFFWTPVGGVPATFNNWKGEYFNNPSLIPPVLYVRDDAAIDFDWGLDAPIEGFNYDNFSVRWSKDVDLNPGTYQFHVTVVDGVRLWVNDILVINEWHLQAEDEITKTVTVPGGSTPIVLEYYDARDNAVIKLDWTQVSGSGMGTSTTTSSSTATTTAAATPVAAPSGLSATMTGALYLNVRDEPSMDGTVVGNLSRNQTVEMTGYKSIGGYWIEIVLPGGQTGWVSSRYMTTGTPVTDLAVKR
ncbi:MAG: PA14 domain-containing protein [Chloroflexota bacterium]